MKRLMQDKILSAIIIVMMIFVSLIVIALIIKSNPILQTGSLISIICSDSWHPMKGEFGFLPFIAGTLWVTLLALIMAVPIALMSAIYLSIYAPLFIREFSKPFIDLLAGIPSVIYGIWGVLIIVPFVKNIIAPFFNKYSSGYSVLSGGIVLSIMILPIIIHITMEIIATVPGGLNEASLSLGATQWQSVKHVIVRKGMPGIIAAIVLGLSRAFGETMAVLMVAGNVVKLPTGPLDPGYALPALIANNYGEMLSIPMYDSALMLASLILLIVILFFNVISRLILLHVKRRIA